MNACECVCIHVCLYACVHMCACVRVCGVGGERGPLAYAPLLFWSISLNSLLSHL